MQEKLEKQISIFKSWFVGKIWLNNNKINQIKVIKITSKFNFFCHDLQGRNANYFCALSAAHGICNGVLLGQRRLAGLWYVVAEAARS